MRFHTDPGYPAGTPMAHRSEGTITCEFCNHDIECEGVVDLGGFFPNDEDMECPRCMIDGNPTMFVCSWCPPGMPKSWYPGDVDDQDQTGYSMDEIRQMAAVKGVRLSHGLCKDCEGKLQ